MGLVVCLGGSLQVIVSVIPDTTLVSVAAHTIRLPTSRGSPSNLNVSGVIVLEDHGLRRGAVDVFKKIRRDIRFS